MISTAALKALFLLDPEVVFLNHGSFGATPRPVFEAYQDWQRRLERQPVLFLGRELDEHLRAARRELGTYLGADPNDLTFVPNATFGVNMVARSLVLRPGDEVLASDHEYGACNHVWEYLCGKTGARYVRQPIPFPAGSAGEIAEQFWRGVTEHTRVIFLSHITSPTALRLPVEMICQRAQAAGILTLIDGAHAPGQIPLDLEALAADFYVGNLHKWALCPKGAAFLYARRHRQDLVEPLVISWGWGAHEPSGPDSPFVNRVQWWGTRDPAASLSVPAAIQFQADHDWREIGRRCHQLASETMHRICDLTGLPPAYPAESGLYWQMVAAPLPPIADLGGLKERLYHEYRVEVPLIEWNGRPFIRVSVQGYNRPDDLDVLIDGLKALLPQVAAPSK